MLGDDVEDLRQGRLEDLRIDRIQAVRSEERGLRVGLIRIHEAGEAGVAGEE